LFVYDYRRNYWFTIGGTAKSTYKPGPAAWGGTTYVIFMTEVLDAYAVPHVFCNLGSGSVDAAVFDLFSADPDANVGDLGGVANYGFGRVSGGVVTVDKEIATIAALRGTDFGAPGLQHSMSRVLINHNTLAITETMTLTVYLDKTRNYKTRSGLTLDGAREWKNYGFSTRGTKALMTELRIVRSSIYDLAISAIQLHGDVWGWKPEEGL